MSTVMQNVTHDTNCQRLHGACTDAHNRTHADAHVHWCAHVPSAYASTSSTKNSHPTHTCGGSAKPGGIITFQTFNQHKCTDQLLFACKPAAQHMLDVTNNSGELLYRLPAVTMFDYNIQCFPWPKWGARCSWWGARCSWWRTAERAARRDTRFGGRAKAHVATCVQTPR